MNKGSLDTKKKGLIGLGALVVLAGATILGSDPLYKAIDDMARPAIYTAGTYTASARGYGGPVTVTVKVSTKAIESIDVVGEKETLLDQVVPSLPDAIIGKQTLDMDAVSGATLSSNAIIKAVEKALAEARGEAAEEETTKAEETAAGWNDGTYSYESPEFDDNGYKDQVNMTIKDGKITALSWDCVDKDGKLKSNLSMDGQYVMTEDGPKWYEQADAVVKYVLDKQSLDGLINEDGYTDTVASVSINLYGFAGGVEDCLRQSSEGGTAAASVNAVKDGSYSYESPEFDGNGYKDQVAMTIQNGKITALTWDCVDKDGKKKSNLSMNGEYVMTEDGPKWHEQAESVVAYVLENQSLDGLINEDGYTDTIASVSINLYGFTGGVEDCLKQASK